MATPGSRGESGDSPVDPPNYEHLSAQLSVLLAEMVRAQEVAVADAWSPDLRPGGTIGRFLLTRELGRGGFGVVYEAMDGDLNRTVALKVVRPGTRIAARGNEWLLREAEAVARLNHPNIVTLHDFGQGPTGPYLVFELLRGQSLSDRLRAGAMPLDEVIDVAIAVSRALVHAHGAGVIHRDLTSANVFLVDEGVGGGGLPPPTGRGQSPSNPELGAVKVLDFGLAHLFGRDGANDGGTPAYMAPEQWEGDRGDGRTDLFALGVILFQALTGRYPYKVDKGWSEALEPGETPKLPRQAAPAPLRRLVRELIDREPELRPQHARNVRDALLALRKDRDGAGRKRVVWAALAVAAAASTSAGWLFMTREAPPGEQVRVVVAAMDNGAGEPTLDAVPGLLTTALEPSPRVKVVPQTRLAYVARQAGMGEPGRIDAEKGKALARLVGAPVVLSPSAWKEDGHPTIAVRAIASESGNVLFTARAPVSTLGALSATVDELSSLVRRELNERTADRKLGRPVAEAVTASPEAARFFYEGIDCLRRAGLFPVVSCAPAFERALSFDPTFPLAHYQLAALHFAQGASGDEARPHVAAALRVLDRLPVKEATLIRALGARLDGKLDEALRGYDALLAAEPEDPQILSAASELQIQRGDWASAARYLEKLVVVAPDEDYPLLSLIEAHGRLNRITELSAVYARLRAEVPGRTLPIVHAAVWLGRYDEAVDAARRAVADRGAGELRTLWFALYAGGRVHEMETVASREAAARPGEWPPRVRLELSLALQGRIGEALRHAADNAPLRSQTEWGRDAYQQAMLAVSSGDRELVWRHAARAFALEPSFSADLAIVLALMGDGARAEPLGRRLKPGSVAEAEFRALLSWRGGEAANAMAELAAAEVRDPYPVDAIPPAYLLAEVAAAIGDDLGTLAAVSRFQRLPPRGHYRAWAYPRSILLAAAAHLHLGDRATARAEVDRLLHMLGRSDPTLPLLRQARELRSKL